MQLQLTEGNGSVRGGKQAAVDAATADREGMEVSGVEAGSC